MIEATPSSLVAFGDAVRPPAQAHVQDPFASLASKEKALSALIAAVVEKSPEAIRAASAIDPEAVRGLLGVDLQGRRKQLREVGVAQEAIHAFENVYFRPGLESINMEALWASSPNKWDQNVPEHSRNLEQLRVWRAMHNALSEAGDVASEHTKSLHRLILQRDFLDVDTLQWMLDRELLSQEWIAKARPENRCALGQLLCVTLREQGPKEMALFERVKSLGWTSEEQAIVGVSELSMHMLFACAQRLIAQGEPLRESLWGETLSWPPSEQGAIEGYLRMTVLRSGWPPGWEGCFAPMTASEEMSAKNREDGTAQEGGEASSQSEKIHTTVQAVVQGLRQLVSWGASVGQPRVGSEEANRLEKEGGSRKKQGRSWVWGLVLEILETESVLSAPLAHALGQELLSMGVSPNEGSEFALALFKQFGWDCDWLEPFDPMPSARMHWAQSFGFEMQQHLVLLAQSCTLNAKYTFSRLNLLEDMGLRLDRLSATDPSPIEASLRHGMWDKLEWMHKKGAPLHYINASGECALHALVAQGAAVYGQQLAWFLTHEPVRALIEQRSTRSGAVGETPLHRACSGLNRGAIEQLLAAGANINAQDEKGWTPLRHVLRKSSEKALRNALPIVQLLLAHGADASIVDQFGKTPAQSAAARAPIAALAALLKERPQDLVDPSDRNPMAKKTERVLRSRGGEALALAEHTQLRQWLAVSAQKSQSPQGVSEKSLDRRPDKETADLPSVGNHGEEPSESQEKPGQKPDDTQNPQTVNQRKTRLRL